MPLPLQQSPEFANALRAYGAPLVSRDPVVLRRKLGPLSVTLASRISIATQPARPRLLNGEEDAPALYRAAGYRQVLTPVHVAEWDLTGGDLTSGMSGKWRNLLRKGRSQDLAITQHDWNGAAHPLFDHAAATARKRRFRSYPVGLLTAFAQTNPKAALIFEARHHQELVAACLVLCHGSIATYQTAWASDRGKKLNAARVVLTAAAEHLCTRGVSRFDLGIVETDHTPNLTRFKLGTGAQLRRLGGTWIRVR